MSQRDPLDSFEEELFRAVRRERTQSDARERTANAVVESYRRRRFRRSVFALAGATALAAAAVLVLWRPPKGQSIQAEHIAPKHSVPSVVAVASAPKQLKAVIEPKSAASNDTAPLPRGLAPSVASTTLEEEIAMLDRARSELTLGKPQAALSLLDQYDRVSGGHLTAEATLLRIQALSSSGHASLAAKLAQRLVDSDPNGPVAERARSYISESPDAHEQRAGADKRP
ncbi:MAG: hypothetical protein ACOY0T_17070 [Myxococcota bacterium]